MIIYRRLFSADAHRLRAHYLRLTGADRVLRFSGGVSNEAIAEHCQNIDWTRAYLIGGFADQALRAVAELQFMESLCERRCELGVSVEQEWQHHGVGGELVRRAVVVARNREVQVIEMTCLPENQPMQQLARRLDGVLSYHPGEVEAEILTPYPTVFTVLEEACWSGFAALAAVRRAMTVRGDSTPSGEPAV